MGGQEIHHPELKMRLYDFLPSGNGYKVRLLLSQLDIPFAYVETDILSGETQTDEFLAMNPNGKIPTLRLPSGDILTESNAILLYLAEGTRFLPEDKLGRAHVNEWLFFEQYSHEPNVAVPRFWKTHGDMNELQTLTLPQKMENGYKALSVMEARLRGGDYLVGDAYSVADIALYAYTHVAHEGGFDLSNYPGINQWMQRVQDQKNNILITDTFQK